jgi:hypothetical protein
MLDPPELQRLLQQNLLKQKYRCNPFLPISHPHQRCSLSPPNLLRAAALAQTLAQTILRYPQQPLLSVQNNAWQTVTQANGLCLNHLILMLQFRHARFIRVLM